MGVTIEKGWVKKMQQISNRARSIMVKAYKGPKFFMYFISKNQFV